MYMLRSPSHDTKQWDTNLPRSFSHWSGEYSLELTQHVRETTSEVSEQNVGEKNFKYDHSNKNCRVVLSCGTVYCAVLGGSNIGQRENCWPILSCGTSLGPGSAVGKKGVSEEGKGWPFPLPSPQDPLWGMVLGYRCTGYYSVQGDCIFWALD